MSHWGDNISQELHPDVKHRTLETFYQEDQGGWPFVRLSYKEYEILYNDNTKITEKHHHLSADEARLLAAELIAAANRVEKK